MSRKSSDTSLVISGQQVPLRIFYEFRRSARVSLGKDAVLLRLPSYQRNRNSAQYLDWVKNWLENQLKKKPAILHQYQSLPMQNGNVIRTRYHQFHIRIEQTENKRANSRISEDLLLLRLHRPQSAFTPHQMRSLMSSGLASYYLPFVEERVKRLNELHFSFNYSKVALRYTSTKWGSCSSKGRLMFSTRLLLVPEDVLNYVIIHELAHLSVMNHSLRFWKLVAGADPDYLKKERWLNESSHLCDFRTETI